MAITWGDVAAVAPELANIGVATQTKILAIVGRCIDPVAWGEFADDGATYLAAHLASIRGNQGLLNAESLGPMSRSYSVPPGLQGTLALSTYGAQFQWFQRIAVGPGAMVP